MNTMSKSRFLLCVVFLVVSSAVYARGNTATIYVVKKQQFLTGGSPTIMINEVQVGKLSRNSYFECVVAQGPTTVSVFFNGKQKDLKILAQGGSEYYVCTDIESYSTGGGSFSIGFGNKNNAISLGRNAGQQSSIDYAVNISRIDSAKGRGIIDKCKKRQFVDMSDYINPEQEEQYYRDNTQLASKGSSENALVKQEESLPKSDVDVNIPKSRTTSENTFVLIIANEDYSFVDNVAFALNDGKIFREYCINTLGVPERQVWLYENATLGIISSGVSKMRQAMTIFDDSKAIVYYCGHGIPDEKTGDSYILPVDGTGTDMSSCYSLNKLYSTLSSAQTVNVTYFLDACFSGANRNGSMLVAARGVAREAKEEQLEGNTVVFSAASGDETAMPYKEKGHGLFTYFLLKKLQETEGNVTYGELADYINQNVRSEALLTNDKPQNPVVATSEELINSWKRITIK